VSTTTTTEALVLVYGPRDTAQTCHITGCGNTLPADPRDDFGFETEDSERPICDQCLKTTMRPEHDALAVLRIIAEAFTAGGGHNGDAAQAFLWTISEGIALLEDPQ